MTRFALDKTHRDYFDASGAIKFQDLISKKQALTLTKGIQLALQEKKALSSEMQFLKGKDLWRDYPQLKPLVLSKQFAALGAELTREKKIRYGFDLFLPKTSKLQNTAKENRYLSFLQDPSPLSQRFALQGILFGLLLNLEETTADETPFFPHLAGEGVFFSANYPLDFSNLSSEQNHLLIVYCGPTSIYIRHPTDPHEGFLKTLGHVFGDRLSDSLHPLLFRS